MAIPIVVADFAEPTADSLSNDHPMLFNPEESQTFMLSAADDQDIPWHRQRLRVPREDWRLLAQPDLVAALDLARRNQEVIDRSTVDLQGRSLEQLRRRTRQQAINAACGYTSELLQRPVHPPQEWQESSSVLFVGGHQPSLFHPGVWVKNFAIGAMAARSGGLSLNLVIDNDTFSSSRIRVPAGSRQHPKLEGIPFDADRPTQPWEDAEILDRALFESFGERVSAAMAEWNVVPLIGEMWPRAVEMSARSSLLRDCFTAARNRWERQWGAENLELPLSRMCESEPFLWFASHLLAHLPRFQTIYNQVLNEFRHVNKVRSRTHPVPPLGTAGDWLEAPFWVWRKGGRVRQRLHAKQVGREVWLSDGTGDVFAKLPLTEQMDACCAVEVLQQLPARGIRLRTRALTTTLFARLCLADLFVHGIGGAKYDEMTDHLIARFFRLAPPGFQTMSATLHLSIAEPFPVERADEIRLLRFLRDLTHNPDRHLSGELSPEAQSLVVRKQALIAQQHAARTVGLSRRERRQRSRANFERFRALQAINRELAPFVEGQRRSAEADLSGVRDELQANQILQSREFSFALFPADKPHRFFAELWEHPTDAS